jgi:hypothetical protein
VSRDVAIGSLFADRGTPYRSDQCGRSAERTRGGRLTQVEDVLIAVEKRVLSALDAQQQATLNTGSPLRAREITSSPYVARITEIYADVSL